MAVWYCGSTKWTAVTAWAASTAYNVGDLRRQLATPTVGNERVFRCTTAGTSGGTEPTWTLTKGGTTNDGTAVWTEVTGNSAYGWGAAAARCALFLNGASSWMSAGDTLYVSNNHAETQSSVMSLTSNGSDIAPAKVVCVSDTAAPPTARATTGTVTTTGNSQLTITGHVYAYGVTFSAGSGNSSGSYLQLCGSTTADGFQTFESCGLTIGSTNVAPSISAANPSNKSKRVTLINCTLKWSAVATYGLAIPYPTRMIGGSAASTGSVPATFTADSNLTAIGVDLSAFGSGKNVIDATFNTPRDVTLLDCKFGASVTVVNGTAARGVNTVINCDSADTVYRFYRSMPVQGVEQHETTIVRTGGASDGTTAVSRKIVTTANSSILAPYESMPLEFWNTNLSAQTITIPVLTDNVTLTDADAWIEVEYLGTSGNPLGVIVSGRMSDPIFGTPANHATDSTSTWTTTGLGTPVKQNLVSPSFTAQKQGLIRVWVKVARSSTTIYYDPKALSTSGRQYMSEAGVVNEGASSSGSGYSRGRVVNN